LLALLRQNALLLVPHRFGLPLPLNLGLLVQILLSTLLLAECLLLPVLFLLTFLREPLLLLSLTVRFCRSLLLCTRLRHLHSPPLLLRSVLLLPLTVPFLSSLFLLALLLRLIHLFLAQPLLLPMLAIHFCPPRFFFAARLRLRPLIGAALLRVSLIPVTFVFVPLLVRVPASACP